MSRSNWAGARSPSSARANTCADDSLGPKLKAAFGGVYIVNERFKKGHAEQMIAAGEADAVAFGKAFLANPDLVRRLRDDAPLNNWDTATFYTAGAGGLCGLSGAGMRYWPASFSAGEP